MRRDMKKRENKDGNIIHIVIMMMMKVAAAAVAVARKIKKK